MWPEIEIICASERLDLAEHLRSIEDEKLVVDMFVGDLQHVIEYPSLGFAVEQGIPEDVLAAYDYLITMIPRAGSSPSDTPLTVELGAIQQPNVFLWLGRLAN